ncbi:hypothetical protein NESM_000591500 [Novymonas esmeraldas]|uniref:Uncharacterized protein n=1 Tax=Novymonas esmeraldas TaxID=1808958 RepID=A0AAW0ESL8_9TRYP
MSCASPVEVLWDDLLRAAAKAPPATRTARHRHRRQQRCPAPESVYASKKRWGHFWCAVPCRPERVSVKTREKRVTFSPIVTVVEFAVVPAR